MADYEYKISIQLKGSQHIRHEEILEEAVWIDKAKKDLKHFGFLYDKYFERIFGYIYRRAENAEMAADLTSQVFMKAMEQIRRYEFRGLPFSAWLYKIAGNEVSKYYNEKKKHMVINIEQEEVLRIFESGEEDDREIQIKLLMKTLKRLTLQEIYVLELRFMEEKNFKEIAFILEISESGAKMKTYRALERLKQLFTYCLKEI